METERMSFFKNGVLTRLPPGFGFHPTDEELVVHYLKRKVFASPLPAPIIPHFDVCKSDPWDLPGETGKEMYFFSTREAKYPNGNKINRATLSGYWKATGKDKPVFATARNSSNHEVVGMKKTLVFYRGKAPHASRTDWIMHEYRLVDTNQPEPVNNVMKKTRKATGDWVLCRIFLKKRNNATTKNGDEDEERNTFVSPKLENPNPVFYDLNLPHAPFSSSSGSTDVSITTDIHHKDVVNFNMNDESSEENDESSSNNSNSNSFSFS